MMHMVYGRYCGGKEREGGGVESVNATLSHGIRKMTFYNIQKFSIGNNALGVKSKQMKKTKYIKSREQSTDLGGPLHLM